MAGTRRTPSQQCCHSLQLPTSRCCHPASYLFHTVIKQLSAPAISNHCPAVHCRRRYVNINSNKLPLDSDSLPLPMWRDTTEHLPTQSTFKSKKRSTVEMILDQAFQPLSFFISIDTRIRILPRCVVLPLIPLHLLFFFSHLWYSRQE